MGAGTNKHKLGARAGKCKSGTRTSKYKLGAKGWGLSKGPGGREMQIPVLFIVNRVKLKLIKRIVC